MALTPLDAALDALYRSPAAVGAVYRPVGGGADTAVRAIRSLADSARVWSPTGSARDQTVISVRTIEVAAPVEGDEIDLAGTTFRVVNAERAPQFDEWRLEVETA